MSRALLIKTLIASTDCSHRAAKRAVDDILEVLCATLRRRRKLSFSNFGTFHVVPLARRTRTNPRTGQQIMVAASETVRFRASDFLRKMVADRSKSVKMNPVITHTKPSRQIEPSAGRSMRSSSDGDLTLRSPQGTAAPKRKTKTTPQKAAPTPASPIKKPAADRRNESANAAPRGKNKDR